MLLPCTTRIVRSLSHDPWHNLAYEEYLLNHCSENQIILYLWQNDQTVVIGRNQNAWKECRCQQLEQDGGKLARRLSGGGAVFHDLGNLNFTFVMDKKLYNLEKQLSVILQAVQAQGIDAQFSGRNDLTVRDQKFSGNAFYHTDKFSYHHGTVLIDTDFAKLGDYLQVSKEKIQSKGVDSVRSRVVNLKTLKSNLTIEIMQHALKESFASIYGGESAEELIEDGGIDLTVLYEKYSSWEWRYGNSPQFDLTFQHRFVWGEIDLGLNLDKGVITSAHIYSDAMNALLIKDLAHSLAGLKLDQGEISAHLNLFALNYEENALVNELNQWLCEKIGQV